MDFVNFLLVASAYTILALCFALLVQLLCTVLKVKPEPIPVANPRRQAVLAGILVVTVIAVTAALELFNNVVYRPLLHLDARPPFSVDIYDVLFAGLLYTATLTPLFLIGQQSHQSLESIGLRAKNGRQMLSFGLILGAVYFAVVGIFAPLFGGVFIGFSISLAFGFIVYTIVGFAEETVWRGYVQARFAAAKGPWFGLLTTSVVYACLHFPARYFLYSGAPLESLASTLLLIPAGLLFGYVMQKTQNVIPCAVFHTVANWSALFWGISSF